MFDKLRLQKRQYRSEIIRQFCSIKNALSIYNEAQDVNEFELKYKQKNNSKTEFICVFKKKNKNINDVQTLELKIKEEDLKNQKQ
ncbi:hypothetical protein H8D83_01600 [Candidatus Woesearchaeota archaeon]|nr:hypothetical protein [Candidatus Woesearchaeota archaeon]